MKMCSVAMEEKYIYICEGIAKAKCKMTQILDWATTANTK